MSANQQPTPITPQELKELRAAQKEVAKAFKGEEEGLTGIGLTENQGA